MKAARTLRLHLVVALLLLAGPAAAQDEEDKDMVEGSGSSVQPGSEDDSDSRAKPSGEQEGAAGESDAERRAAVESAAEESAAGEVAEGEAGGAPGSAAGGSAPAKAGDLDEPFEDPLAKIKGLGEPEGAAEPEAEVSPFDFELKHLVLKWSGKIETNARFRVEEKSVGDYYTPGTHELPVGVDRNENIFKLKLDAIYGRFAGIADIDFVWLGFPGEIESIGELSMRNRVDPFYLEPHGLYLEGCDLGLEGLDLRVGYQKVLWGAGDQFNPTNNLNADDVEDVLLFGEQMANLMAKLDYNPWRSLTLSGVLVPVFKPALLPRSAPLGLAGTDRMPMIEQQAWLRHKLHVENGLSGLAGYPTVVGSVHPELPETSLENMQYAFRLAGSIAGHDLSVSYYRGFSDLPQPTRNHTQQVDQPLLDPAGGACEADADCPLGACIDGQCGIAGVLSTDVTLIFPKMHVLGFNAAGEIPLTWIHPRANGIGYRFELGVYFPERVELTMDQGDLVLAGVPVPAGEYDYGLRGGARPTVLDDEPFAKWVLGLDYSFNEYVYLNIMWVHGLVDEFGAGDILSEGYSVRKGGVVDADRAELMNAVIMDFLLGTKEAGPRYSYEILRPRLADYAVVITDFKFDDQRGLLRLFFMLDMSGYFEDRWDEAQGRRVRKWMGPLTDGGFSAIIYPELNYNFGGGFELGAGGLIQLGKSYTKFGDAANGGSLVWTRARYSF
ncbi:MAG: hypothetical protein JXR96_22345 [Deltaproteobacteria bacterium]|nr:hypothetical protein [Deltaproteobacteria bacterium]